MTNFFDPNRAVEKQSAYDLVKEMANEKPGLLGTWKATAKGLEKIGAFEHFLERCKGVFTLWGFQGYQNSLDKELVEYEFIQILLLLKPPEGEVQTETVRLIECAARNAGLVSSKKYSQTNKHLISDTVNAVIKNLPNKKETAETIKRFYKNSTAVQHSGIFLPPTSEKTHKVAIPNIETSEGKGSLSTQKDKTSPNDATTIANPITQQETVQNYQEEVQDPEDKEKDDTLGSMDYQGGDPEGTLASKEEIQPPQATDNEIETTKSTTLLSLDKIPDAKGPANLIEKTQVPKYEEHEEKEVLSKEDAQSLESKAKHDLTETEQVEAPQTTKTTQIPTQVPLEEKKTEPDKAKSEGEEKDHLESQQQGDNDQEGSSLSLDQGPITEELTNLDNVTKESVKEEMGQTVTTPVVTELPTYEGKGKATGLSHIGVITLIGTLVLGALGAYFFKMGSGAQSTTPIPNTTTDPAKETDTTLITDSTINTDTDTTLPIDLATNTINPSLFTDPATNTATNPILTFTCNHLVLSNYTADNHRDIQEQFNNSSRVPTSDPSAVAAGISDLYEWINEAKIKNSLQQLEGPTGALSSASDEPQKDVQRKNAPTSPWVDPLIYLEAEILFDDPLSTAPAEKPPFPGSAQQKQNPEESPPINATEVIISEQGETFAIGRGADDFTGPPEILSSEKIPTKQASTGTVDQVQTAEGTDSLFKSWGIFGLGVLGLGLVARGIAAFKNRIRPVVPPAAKKLGEAEANQPTATNTVNVAELPEKSTTSTTTPTATNDVVTSRTEGELKTIVKELQKKGQARVKVFENLKAFAARYSKDHDPDGKYLESFLDALGKYLNLPQKSLDDTKKEIVSTLEALVSLVTDKILIKKLVEQIQQRVQSIADSQHMTILHRMVQAGNIAVVEAFSDGFRYAGKDGFIPLFYVGDNVEMLKVLIEKEANLKDSPLNFRNYYARNGKNILHVSAEKGNLNVCAYLIEKKLLDPFTKDHSKKSAFEYLVDSYHQHSKEDAKREKIQEIIKKIDFTNATDDHLLDIISTLNKADNALTLLLLSQIKDFDSKTTNGQTAHEVMAKNGCIEGIKRIAEKGVMPNLNALQIAAAHHDDDALIEVLFEANNTFKSQDIIDRILYFAADSGHLNVCTYLINNLQADPLSNNKLGDFALRLIIENIAPKDEQAVLTIIKGVNSQGLNEGKLESLFDVAKSDKVFEALLAKMDDVKEMLTASSIRGKEHKYTVIDYLAYKSGAARLRKYRNELEALGAKKTIALQDLKEYLSKNQNINPEDNASINTLQSTYKLLTTATQKNDFQLFELALEAGADPIRYRDIEDTNLFILSYAISSGQFDHVSLLIKHGLSLFEVNIHNVTEFEHLLQFYNNKEKLPLQKKAVINIINNLVIDKSNSKQFLSELEKLRAKNFFFNDELNKALKDKIEQANKFIAETGQPIASTTTVVVQPLAEHFNLAIRNGDVEGVKKLIEGGARANLEQLKEAIRKHSQNVELADVLAGSITDFKKNDNNYALQTAVGVDSKTVSPIAFLLINKYGANPLTQLPGRGGEYALVRMLENSQSRLNLNY